MILILLSRLRISVCMDLSSVSLTGSCQDVEENLSSMYCSISASPQLMERKDPIKSQDPGLKQDFVMSSSQMGELKLLIYLCI